VTPERIGLSFDDGPATRWTPQILNLLAAHGARATFFVVGQIAERDQDLVRRISAAGHEVGNHTWSHPALARDCDDKRVRTELSRTNELLDQILGAPPAMFRAPYYNRDDRVDAIGAELGLRHARGDVVPPDWHPRFTAGLIATFVLQGISSGAIVGLHDGVPRLEIAEEETRQPTVDAIAAILPRLGEREITCLPVSEIVAA
jgi:peptidoglycan/xylan/chitin deacetylase (PgdA/CDA1 family)